MAGRRSFAVSSQTPLCQGEPLEACSAFPAATEPDGGFSVQQQYRDWLRKRADLPELLGSLSGKVLACNCNRASCHGHVLIALHELIFPCIGPKYTAQEASEQHNASHNDYTTIDEDNGLPQHHSTPPPASCTNSNLSTTITRHIHAAPEWAALTEVVRGLGERYVWEFCFSGAGVLSQAFQEAGWLVAPPIDMQATPTHDLLNPHFQAVALGLMLEGRVALLHMGPPCSSVGNALADLCEKFALTPRRRTRPPAPCTPTVTAVPTS